MLNIAICDDIVEFTSQLENMIIEIGNEHLIDVDIEVFYSGDKLLEYINNGNSFDLIFLDIEMGNINGIEVGKEIRDSMKDDKTQIAYISGMTKYAMDLFQIRPIDFLTKPLSINKVEEVLLTALRINNTQGKYFKYRKGQALHKINIEQITYFEANNRKVNIITKDNIDSFYGKLSEVYDKVEDLGFLYIHKSFIVNRLHIKSYTYDKIILLTDKELPISQANRKTIRDKLINCNRKVD